MKQPRKDVAYYMGDLTDEQYYNVIHSVGFKGNPINRSEHFIYNSHFGWVLGTVNEDLIQIINAKELFK